MCMILLNLESSTDAIKKESREVIQEFPKQVIWTLGKDMETQVC